MNAQPLPPRGPAWRTRWPTLLGLTALLGVALAVRLVWLESDPIWYDEAATIGIAAMDWQVILGAMAEAESSPPGYYIAAKLWSALHDDSIWWLRMLSVLAGVGAIVPVFVLARAYLGGVVPWVAGAFIALAGTHVRLSQDARCYALLFLVTAVAMLAAARLATAVQRGERGLPAAIGLGVLMGLGLWLHATAGLIVVSLNLFVLVLLGRPWTDLRRALVPLVVANLVMLMIAAAPLLAILEQIDTDTPYGDRWILAPGLLDVVRLYGRALVAPFLGDLSVLALGVHLMLLASALLAWWRRRDAMIVALAAMLAGSALLLPLVSQFRPILLDRTVLFMLLPLALLLAAGVANLPRRAMVPAVAVLLLFQAIGVAGWHSVPVRKEAWDQAAKLLQARMVAGEPIVLADSSFVSISLSRQLARIGATVPRMVVVAPASHLEQLAAEHVMPNGRADAAGLCRRLGGDVGTLWLVLRDHPVTVAADNDFTSRHAVRAALAAGGGTLLAILKVPAVELEHWTAPKC